jgi:hypothetical protein
MAKFYKKDAIALFTDENPQSGDTFLVDVQYDDNGSTLTKSYTISIVGSKK